MTTKLRTRNCQSCGESIPEVRLEALPDTRVCVACKRGEVPDRPGRRAGRSRWRGDEACRLGRPVGSVGGSEAAPGRLHPLLRQSRARLMSQRDAAYRGG